MRQRTIPAALAILLSACSFYGKAPLEDIEKASVLFLNRFQEADYDAIYNDTAARFKENKTREEAIASLTEIAAFGRLVNYQRISAGYQGEGDNEMVEATYSAAFEQRRGNILLYFVDEKGEWKLIAFGFKGRG